MPMEEEMRKAMEVLSWSKRAQWLLHARSAVPLEEFAALMADFAPEASAGRPANAGVPRARV